MGIPRVTVYLLVGLLLGPNALLRLFDPDAGLGRLLLGPSTGGPLDGLSELAVGFILFGIGAEFRSEVFRRVGPRVLVMAGLHVQNDDAAKAALWRYFDSLITFASEEVVHLRPSGNAPEFRCYTEADTEPRAQEINKICIDIMVSWRSG